ncbi:MAG: hypothetical protein QW683_08610 [Candidatus Caldarchaeum sp.]
MDTPKKLESNITFSRESVSVVLPRELGTVVVYPASMLAFETVCRLWQTGIDAVTADPQNMSYSFIQCWQNVPVYRESMLALLDTLGVPKEKALLMSPKQLEELLFACEETNQPLIFYIHDVGLPVKKKVTP